jgi:POT family proton-dependent oligopeptide transporter
MTWFQSLNPMIVFLLTPFIIARWTRMARSGLEPAPLSKMATGAAIVALSYVFIAAVSAWHAELGARASWLWAAAFFLLITVGELYILPVGLGLFGRLAPRMYTATTIAAWFLAAFAGNLLAGGIGSLWSRHSPAEFFVAMSGLAGLSALLLMCLNRPVQRFERTVQDRTIDVASPARTTNAN